ncbi:hypothetical protein Tco_1254492 [Tanacetum coccineum]
MDDPNIIMEEYIRLEEEKARRRGVHDLISVEAKFQAIVYNDAFTSEVTLSCEPTVSPLNDNKIDYRISFDKSDDEDYTRIYDKNSFSYKIIYVDDLKTDSKNDNDKVNMPLFPPPEPKVSYFDDLDFLKDFENEFPAIVYNDALTSKSDSSIEPVKIPHRIDEFDLKDEPDLAIRKSMIWYNLKKTCDASSTHFCSRTPMENHPEQHIRGVPRSNSISHFL